MANKLQGTDGKFLPKNGKPRKPVRVIKEIELPLHLSSPTRRSLNSGSYQQKVKAFFAGRSLQAAFNSAMRSARKGNPRSMETLFKIYGLLADKPGVSVNVNQNNLNAAQAAAESRAQGPSSPDQIFRELAEAMERRRLEPSAQKFIATPTTNYEKEQLVDLG